MRNAGEALCMSTIGRNGKAAPERPDLPAERTAAEREPWNEGIDTACETRFAPRAGARDGFFLSEGDKVAVLSPSSLPYRAQAEATMKGLAGWGYVPVEGKHACVDIRTLDDCVGDLRRALEDPEIRAVFCVRGGYGASAVMDRMPEGLIRKAGKMIVGYSDITVYHSAWAAEGVPSVHAPMSRAFINLPEANAEAERRLLRGEIPSYTCTGVPCGRTGEAEGILAGGNLMTFTATLNTAYDCTAKGVPYLLFLEDVEENMNHLHLYLTLLKHAGVLERAAGLVFGEWIGVKQPDGSGCSGTSRGGLFRSVADMIRREFTDGLGVPVAFGFPAGHGEVNLPLLMGAKARLAVEEDRYTLSWPGECGNDFPVTPEGEIRE